MADVAWPPSLPSQQFGQTEKPSEILATFSVGDWAKPLRRKRVSGLAVVTSYAFTFNAIQMQQFRALWEGPLSSGANDIVMYDRSIERNVRLTPLDAFEATCVAPNIWNVTIPFRREIA